MQSNDVNLKGIVIFLGILAGTVGLAYFVISSLYGSWEAAARRSDQQAPPRPPATNQPYFPQPREQPNPLVDLNALRAREDADLTNYGWIDRSNGIVRIPIDRAIELLTQQGGRR